jgi:hypothetical protein
MRAPTFKTSFANIGAHENKKRTFSQDAPYSSPHHATFRAMAFRQQGEEQCTG